MKKIVKFNSEDEFNKYLFSKVVNELGEGSEGVCYKGRDGLAYKEILSGEENGFPSQNYCINEVITTSDIQSKSFAFPHILFVTGDKFVGYTCDLVSYNYIDSEALLKNGINEINFDNLITAYYIMREDAIKLANKGISIYDLTFNLMFDGNRLVGVDTCGYYKTKEDIKERNIRCVDEAIKRQFADCMIFNYDYDVDEENLDVVSLLRKIKHEFQFKNKTKSYY